MLFQEEHIVSIRDGEKTVTRRDWAPKYPRPSEGAVRMATTEMFATDEECDCYIRVIDVRVEALGEMDEEDADAEGGYTMEEFREAWEEINGESWDKFQMVDVIEFEYVGQERPDENEKLVTDGGRQESVREGRARTTLQVWFGEPPWPGLLAFLIVQALIGAAVYGVIQLVQ